MVATDTIDWAQQDFQRSPSSGVVVKRTFIEVVDAQKHDDQVSKGLQRRACSDPLIYDRPDVLQIGANSHADEDSDFELNGLSDDDFEPEDSDVMHPHRLDSSIEGPTLLPRCPQNAMEKEEIRRLWASTQPPVFQASGHADPMVSGLDGPSNSNTAICRKEALHSTCSNSDGRHQHHHGHHHNHHYQHHHNQHAECDKEHDATRYGRHNAAGHGHGHGHGPVMGKTRSLPTALPTKPCKSTPTLLGCRGLLSSPGLVPAGQEMGMVPELTPCAPQSLPLSRHDQDSSGSKHHSQSQPYCPLQSQNHHQHQANYWEHLQHSTGQEKQQQQQQHQYQQQQLQHQQQQQHYREISDLESQHSFAHLESVSQGGITSTTELEPELEHSQLLESASHCELRRLISENTRLSLENRLLRENMRLAWENRLLGGPGSWVEGDSREASDRGQSPVQKVSSVSSVEAGADRDRSPLERAMRAAAAAAAAAAKEATTTTAAAAASEKAAALVQTAASDPTASAPKATRGCTATQRRRRDRQRKKEAARKAAAALMAEGGIVEPVKDKANATATSNGSGPKAVPSTPAAPAAPAAPTAPTAVPEVQRTTVMLRNLPNNYTRAMVLTLLDAEGFKGLYDFLYLPVDFKSRACLGYAFVNLVNPSVVPLFWAKFEGYKQWAWVSRKVCRVTWSGPQQGLAAHLERYRNSPVMHSSVPEEFQPVYLQGGVRMPFPPPVKAPRAPRIRNPLNRVSPACDVSVGELVDGATSSF